MREKSFLGALVTVILLVVTCCALLDKVLAQEKTKSDKLALLTFDQFKILFHKSYQSIREETWRNLIFLDRMMQSAASYYSYKYKRSTSFESINHMSDWTHSEFRQTLIPPAPKIATGSQKSNSNRMTQTQAETSPPEETSDVPIALTIARKLRLENIYWEAKSMLDYDKGGYRPDLPDEIHIDHRTKSNCLSPVQKQGKCGSCYIFSTLSLYEWAYCIKFGKQIKFSEQYLIDCGHMGGVEGCAGGSEFKVSEFVSNYGLELQARYPYVFTQQTCPYSADSKANMGYMNMMGTELGALYPNKLEKELISNPYMVRIYPSKRLQTYGGGLDDGKGCGDDKSYEHSVLVVGSGRQAGYEYWIIRNSYGHDWGEQGYYRLRKDSNCLTWFRMGANLLYKVNTRTGIIPIYEFVLNPKYNESILTAHFANEKASKSI